MQLYNFENVTADRKTRLGVSLSTSRLGTLDLVDRLPQDDYTVAEQLMGRNVEGDCHDNFRYCPETCTERLRKTA